jgi:hypothetical protein
MKLQPAYLAVLVAMTMRQVASAELRFESGERRTALVELYTSEGCSSCPPAETFLSRWIDSPRLWKDFVPIAFHVDYWNRLGWPDKWSKAEFTDRQRSYSKAWHNETIYTPAFVLDGKEWNGWSSSASGPPLSDNTPGKLIISSINTNHWRVQFVGVSDRGFEAHGAILAGGLVSDVKAGENRGRRLTHDFAVVAITEQAMVHKSDGFEAELEFSPPSDVSAKDLSIAVWVTPAKSIQPLQAVGGWLRKPLVPARAISTK